ncbi:putative reverse transcriptase domain-containing protein [Tanacetum coccineum]
MVAVTEPTTIQRVMQKARTLKDEAIRNGLVKKNHEKRGNNIEPNRDRSERDENKRTSTRNAFATTTNPVRREYNGTIPKCVSCNLYHPYEIPCRACFNYGRLGHMAKDCKVAPRMVNPVNARNPTVVPGVCYECGGTDYYKSSCPRLNRAQGPGVNRPNQALAIYGGQGRGDNGNQARGRAFMLGAEEARHDSNIVTGIDPSDLGFSYEIEIASRQLVEIDKVIKGMDWLSNHKAKIMCHEKVVRIPLLDGKVLRVIEEKPKEKARHLMSAKAKEQKQEEMVVVRDFPKVFLDDLSGLPTIREIKFRIELVLGAIPVTKSPYRLAPSEMEELSGQLKELQDKEKLYAKFSKCEFWLRREQFISHVINGDGIHVDPSKIEAVKNWEAPRTPSGEEQERSFQTLKDKLCNALVLALLGGSEDFVVYCDASGLGLGYVLMQRELFSDYDCEIRYHPGKANVVVDALSRKERIKPKRIRSMNMTLQSSIKGKILAAQKEASDEIFATVRGLDEMIECRSDGALYYLDRIWVPLKGDVRTLIMDEAHKSKYFVHTRRLGLLMAIGLLQQLKSSEWNMGKG